jgi:hypothetical protein
MSVGPTPSGRRKLLVVAGAGASMQFGMPSVSDVHGLLMQVATPHFSLADDSSKNLYGFLHDAVKDYWSANTKDCLGKTPNFEDVLYAISALGSTYPAGIFTGTLGAFVERKNFPDILYFGERKPVDWNVLSHLRQELEDGLLTEFRKRCREPDPGLSPKVEQFKSFFTVLAGEFDVAVATTNYDDLIYRSLPDIETGFDPADGRFKQGRIVDRSSWPCLLHLHGSVHFDMDLTDSDLHGIGWREDLNKEFHQNSFGRSPHHTAEGHAFPTSSIIAGYGKTEQIQRAPFRSYYSEFDRLVHRSDAVLFLGFSLLDAHVRQAFSDYRDGRDRPVVFIDYADNGVMLAGSSFSDADTGPARAMRVFRVPPGEMKWLGYSHPDSVNALKAAKEFERCSVPGKRLSIWYNGMLEAVDNAPKIINELAK